MASVIAHGSSARINDPTDKDWRIDGAKFILTAPEDGRNATIIFCVSAQPKADAFKLAPVTDDGTVVKLKSITFDKESTHILDDVNLEPRKVSSESSDYSCSLNPTMTWEPAKTTLTIVFELKWSREVIVKWLELGPHQDQI